VRIYVLLRVVGCAGAVVKFYVRRANARRVCVALKCRQRHRMTSLSSRDDRPDQVTSASDVRIASNLLNVENRAAQILAINYEG